MIEDRIRLLLNDTSNEVFSDSYLKPFIEVFREKQEIALPFLVAAIICHITGDIPLGDRLFQLGSTMPFKQVPKEELEAK